jgi:hypothetical protein
MLAASQSYQNYQNGAVSNRLTDAGREEDVLEVTVNLYHRVDRVQSFFSSRPNRDSPPPHPQSSLSSPLWLREGVYTLACGRGGRLVPIPKRGHRHCGTLGIQYTRI